MLGAIAAVHTPTYIALKDVCAAVYVPLTYTDTSKRTGPFVGLLIGVIVSSSSSAGMFCFSLTSLP